MLVASNGPQLAGLKTSFIVYSEFVPISPQVTPKAPSVSAAKPWRVSFEFILLPARCRSSVYRASWKYTQCAMRTTDSPGVNRGVHINALAVAMNTPHWTRPFLAQWPPGSAAHASLYADTELRSMKARFRPDSSDADPRDAYWHVCGLRLAPGPHPSLSACSDISVSAQSWEHITAGPPDRAIDAEP